MSEPTGLPGNKSVYFTNSTSDSQNRFDYYTEQLANAVNIYYTPILIALGIIGNLLSVFVFFCTNLRFKSTSQYLSALAVSDTIFLLQLLPPWLNDVQVSDVFNHPGFCQVFVYFSYASCCMSAWLVVAFTVERFVAVLYPLQRNAIFSMTRSRHIIGAVCLGALMVNTPVLHFATANNDCSIDMEYIDYAERFNTLDTIISFTLPLLVITGLNIRIMIGVCRLGKVHHGLLKDQVPVFRHVPHVRMVHGPTAQQRVTRMLLIVSTVFVVLNMPAYTMRLVAYAYNLNKEEHRRWAAVQQLALNFFNTNFGINFILYCMSGQNFRDALRQLVPCLGRRARRAEAIRRVTTSTQPARASSISTSFTCTEAANNQMVETTQHQHDHYQKEEHYIARWIFVNARQRRERQLRLQRQLEEIEMPHYITQSNM